jgi:hypothetical protein
MHCDDKRMFLVLEEEIITCWESLKKTGFQDESALKELNESIINYNDYKNSFKQR